MKADRQDKGAWYFFIQPSTLLPAATRDWYFDSDDQRYADENYFLTREAVRECAEALAPIASRLATLAGIAKDPAIGITERSAADSEIRELKCRVENTIADAKKE